MKVFETAPLAVTEGLDPRSKAVPVQLQRAARPSVPPGRYECQVTVLEPDRAEGGVLARAGRDRALTFTRPADHLCCSQAAPKRVLASRHQGLSGDDSPRLFGR